MAKAAEASARTPKALFAPDAARPQAAPPAANAANAANVADSGKPEPSEFDPALFDIWLRQATLLLMWVAAAVGFAAAWMSDRSLLKCVFCACLAATATGCVGMVMVRIMVSQLPGAVSKASSRNAEAAQK